VLRLTLVCLAVLSLGFLVYSWLGRPAVSVTEVPMLSEYGSYQGANNRHRLLPHAGVDFGGRLGSPVIAAADGVVSDLVDWPTGCGRGVVLSHPEFRRYTVYCHLQETVVREGQEVARGQPIGRMGMTGMAAGVSHVHLELCTRACRSHADGDLRGTADPLKFSAGCFDPRRSYARGRLVLTYPVACGGVVRAD
jgi:murein DD-endopeptidase MepM/ murein hydrolase activator NlpD